MFKLLFKYIIPFGLLLTIGIVGNNYFFGTPEEQQSSIQIISKVRGLGGDVFSLLASEKQKFSNGKYDDAMTRIGSSLTYLKQRASSLAGAGQPYLYQLNLLEQEKLNLQQQLDLINQDLSLIHI